MSIDPATVAKNTAFFSIVYPAGEDFNMEYYLKSHMPMVAKTWGSAGLKSWKIIKTDPSTGYQVQAILEFESVEKMTALLQNSDLTSKVMADLPNYTKASPLRLFGAEVAKS